MKFTKSLILTSLLLIFGCATPKRAELESTNPQQIFKNMQDLKANLIVSNADVLAKDIYVKGDDKLDDALETLKDKKDGKETLKEPC